MIRDKKSVLTDKVAVFLGCCILSLLLGELWLVDITDNSASTTATHVENCPCDLCIGDGDY